jgi:hypothetical protein
MPTTQARLTRARGLHATGSSIRSDNDTSSLSERRVSRRFFFCRWHRAHTYHPLNVKTATSVDRWPASQACMSCAPYPGHMCASGEPLGSHWARLPHAGFAGECSLCVFSLCKSCFIRDIDLCGPMASLVALHALHAVCGATRRVLETADSGRHTPG